jgi:hypothetical protein
MNINTNTISRFELVNLNAPAASTVQRYYFPDQPNLRDKKTFAISAYYNNTMQYALDNTALVNEFDFRYSFLVLYCVNSDNPNGVEAIKLPCSKLNSINYDRLVASYLVNVNGYTPLNDIQIIWEKSYIQMSVPPTNAAAFAWQFGVFYK